MNVQSGSSLLLVLIITTAVLVIVSNSWYSGHACYELVKAQQVYKQRLYATEGLLRYGIILHKHMLMKEEFGDYVITVEPWFCGDDMSYQGLIAAVITSDNHRVRAFLIKDGVRLLAMRCTIHKEKNTEKYYISSWSLDTVEVDEQEMALAK